VAIGVYFSFDSATLDQYDEACRKITGGRAMTKLTDWPGGGCLAHSVWPEGPGMRVFDVWESPEKFEAFGAVLGPILAEVGFPETQPHIIELHNFVAS
jgi:hypothetical protein